MSTNALESMFNNKISCVHFARAYILAILHVGSNVQKIVNPVFDAYFFASHCIGYSMRQNNWQRQSSICTTRKLHVLWKGPPTNMNAYIKQSIPGTKIRRSKNIKEKVKGCQQKIGFSILLWHALSRAPGLCGLAKTTLSSIGFFSSETCLHCS